LNKSKNNLLSYKKNIYSQNGEDGLAERIFEIIGVESKACCEFGAWDGIHLSNCRKLIDEGWRALMIEGDKEKFKLLVKNYSDNNNVKPVNAYVDDAKNNLNLISEKNGMNDFDYLSVDIDGLDYEIFENLNIKPRVICIEVNAGHDPEKLNKIERNIAKNNIGQPLAIFEEIGKKLGYSLVCYNGNAFFVRDDAINDSSLSAISSSDAYEEFLANLSKKEKEWLYLVNLGIVYPYYEFNNNLLSEKSLELNMFDTAKLKFIACMKKSIKKIL